MQGRKFRVPRRKTQRRWRVPPALRRGDETFEGLGLLDELEGAEGLVLWQALRDALLWGEVEPELRPGLFAATAPGARERWVAAAAPIPALEEPLTTLTRLLADPAGTTSAEVAAACRAVAAWAEERGLLGTALAFAQAAATVEPSEAATAFEVGKLARRRNEFARAETWLRRSVALARQSGDWTTYALAYLSLGRMYRQRGNHPAARRHLERAVKVAQRNSLHLVEGMALHEIFILAIDGNGPADEARELAVASFAAYGQHRANVTRLAQDVAYWWITQGLFTRALPVLRSMLPHMLDAAARLMVQGNIARATGGTGDREGFRDAWDACFELLREPGGGEHAAEALLDVAHGAASLGIWDRAEFAAREALEVATRRGAARVRLAAEALLDSIRHHRVVENRPRAQVPAAAAADARFASELVRTLQASDTDPGGR